MSKKINLTAFILVMALITLPILACAPKEPQWVRVAQIQNTNDNKYLDSYISQQTKIVDEKEYREYINQNNGKPNFINFGDFNGVTLGKILDQYKDNLDILNVTFVYSIVPNYFYICNVNLVHYVEIQDNGSNWNYKTVSYSLINAPIEKPIISIPKSILIIHHF